ncbi:MAG TPA: hypothetical protein H9797_04225 [Candidatus Gallimonas gallistercoris]|uniref:Uncharacterized protein n=1 Tax=Candidatus Gallimonas gallistercoris TaxID=2838602 RepID=A0A9D2H2H4_9FIRM|nr:hypothetical protein [Candidatus Gallimonas gallistercoris]
MRKIVFKTIFITLGVVLILAISAFGILSFAAPKAMMSFTSSLGLDAISGDYAYQEYRRSGDIEYLARAFEIAAFEGRSDAAAERFEELYENEGFSDYCKAQDGVELGEDIPENNYRSYACSLGASALYAVAETDDEKLEVYTFALSETSGEFEENNPLCSLALAASEAGDDAFCKTILENMRKEQKFNALRAQSAFEDESEYTEGYKLYLKTIELLEEAVNE